MGFFSKIMIFNELFSSSSCEPKLPLFYMEFIHLMKRQIDDGLSHYIIIKYINEFLVPLTSIGLESGKHFRA